MTPIRIGIVGVGKACEIARLEMAEEGKRVLALRERLREAIFSRLDGVILKGHGAIRKLVTDLQARQEANRAQGKPPGNLYHVISNERISFTSPTEALYQSYWQTLRRGQDNRYVAGGFGRSEDRLVKRDGQWRIKSRKLVVFTD